MQKHFFKHSETLYQTFSKTIRPSDRVYIHPNVHQLYLSRVKAQPFAELEKNVDHCKALYQKSLTQQLAVSDDPLFKPIDDKARVADELLEAFVNIGFDPKHLRVLAPKKEKIWTNYLEQLPQPPRINFNTPSNQVHIFGYGFNVDFLAWLKLALIHPGKDPNKMFHLWLLDHGAFPAWIQEEAPLETFYFKRINQLTYNYKARCLDSLLSFCKTAAASYKLGIVIDDPDQQAWFAKQCELEEIACNRACTFDQQSFHVMIGRLDELCAFNFDTVYMVDFFKPKYFGSPLWTQPERRSLSKAKVFPESTAIEMAYLNQLIFQSEAVYYVFDQQTELPQLYNHRLEQADPIDRMLKAKPIFTFDFKPHLDRHDDMIHATQWPDAETHHVQKLERPTLSATQLTQVLSCPRQFYFAHVMRAQKETREPKAFKVDPLAYGIEIHAFLDRMFTHIKNSTDINDCFDTEKQYALDMLQSKLDPGYQAIWRVEIEMIFKALYRYFLEFKRKVLHTELSWEDHVHPKDSPLGDIIWKGQMDRVDDDQGTRVVVDYKTGKFNKKKTDLFENGQFVQIPLYMLYLKSTRPEQRVRGEIHHILPTGVTMPAVIDDSQLEGSSAELSELIENAKDVLSSQIFIPNPGPYAFNCRRCDYQKLCGPFLTQSIKQKSDTTP